MTHPPSGRTKQVDVTITRTLPVLRLLVVGALAVIVATTTGAAAPDERVSSPINQSGAYAGTDFDSNTRGTVASSAGAIVVEDLERSDSVTQSEGQRGTVPTRTGTQASESAGNSLAGDASPVVAGDRESRGEEPMRSASAGKAPHGASIASIDGFGARSRGIGPEEGFKNVVYRPDVDRGIPLGNANLDALGNSDLDALGDSNLNALGDAGLDRAKPSTEGTAGDGVLSVSTGPHDLSAGAELTVLVEPFSLLGLVDGVIGFIVGIASTIAVYSRRYRALSSLNAVSSAIGRYTAPTGLVGDDPPPPSSEETDPGGTTGEDAVGDEEPLTDEIRVEALLRDRGGRMKQSAIVERTDWSKAKVSRLLTAMAEEGRIVKIRMGRENLVCLDGREPDILEPSRPE